MEIPQVVAGIYVSPIGIVIVARSKQRSKGETFGTARLERVQACNLVNGRLEIDPRRRKIRRIVTFPSSSFTDLPFLRVSRAFPRSTRSSSSSKILGRCTPRKKRKRTRHVLRHSFKERRKEGRKLEWNRSSGEVIFAFNPGRRSGGRRAKGRKSAQVHSDAVVHVVLDRRRTAH